MHVSQWGSALVVGLSVLAALGSLAVLVSNISQLPTAIVLVLAACAVVAMSVVGARSRQWLSNPYW